MIAQGRRVANPHWRHRKVLRSDEKRPRETHVVDLDCRARQAFHRPKGVAIGNRLHSIASMNSLHSSSPRIRVRLKAQDEAVQVTGG
jgi:hypothetical protein